MNRYMGNTGRSVRVPEISRDRQNPGGTVKRGVDVTAPPQRTKPPDPLSGLLGGIGGIFGKLHLSELETDDLLLALVMYLLYRESGDKEFLIILGAMLLA